MNTVRNVGTDHLEGRYAAGGEAVPLRDAPGHARIEQEAMLKEIQQLKATVSYLKEALNSKQAGEEYKANQASAASRGEFVAPNPAGFLHSQPEAGQAKYQAVSEEIAQLRATIVAMHQQMEKIAPANLSHAGQNGAPSSLASGEGTKRFRTGAAFVFTKLFRLAAVLYGTIMGIFRRIVILTVVLAVIYELLVVVPMVGYPGAVKAELSQQAETVRQFVADGWKAAKAVVAQPSTQEGVAAEADKRKLQSAGK